MSNPKKRVILSLDGLAYQQACHRIEELAPYVEYFKISQAQVIEGIHFKLAEVINEVGAKVFLDMKIHNTPDVAVQAYRAALKVPGLKMLTISM